MNINTSIKKSLTIQGHLNIFNERINFLTVSIINTDILNQIKGMHCIYDDINILR